MSGDAVDCEPDQPDDTDFLSTFLIPANAAAFIRAMQSPSALPDASVMDMARRFYADSYLDEQGVRHFEAG